MENQKIKVLVIGGGYAGISLLHKLKKSSNLELTLIDKSESHLLQTHIHKYLSGYYNKEEITFYHKKYCDNNGIKFICDEITDINYEKNYLISKENSLYHYDYLVISTGGISIFPRQIENIIEYTKDIKKIENLDFYRNKFLKLLHSNPKDCSIAIVGGGVSGVQIACEYAQTIKDNNLSPNEIKVTLIEGMDTILPGLDKFLIDKATKRCEELGIKLITKVFASKIQEDRVILANGKEVPYDILIFVIGAVGNSITHIKKEHLNQRNQLKVDEYYRLSPYKNIFCIGDATQALDSKTNDYQAPTAQSARMQAELTAKNIVNSIKDIDLIKNNVSNKGILIDLGGKNCAIGKLFGINLWGKPALWFKKLIYSLHTKKLT